VEWVEMVVLAEMEAVEQAFKLHAAVKLVMVVLAVLEAQEAQEEKVEMVLTV
jgi:hypothetical protein